jgi:hypothetical protein
MTFRPLLCLVAWLVCTPLLSAGQQGAPSPVTPTIRDFAGKTFRLGEAGEGSQPGQDDQSYFIFQPDGGARYRATRGQRVMMDSPLRWGVVRDSLYLLPSSWALVAQGQTQQLARDTLKHGVEKVAGGYQLRRRKELMRLTEVK